jgi:hypothetical protein
MHQLKRVQALRSPESRQDGCRVGVQTGAVLAWHLGGWRRARQQLLDAGPRAGASGGRRRARPAAPGQLHAFVAGVAGLSSERRAAGSGQRQRAASSAQQAARSTQHAAPAGGDRAVRRRAPNAAQRRG